MTIGSKVLTSPTAPARRFSSESPAFETETTGLHHFRINGLSETTEESEKNSANLSERKGTRYDLSLAYEVAAEIQKHGMQARELLNSDRRDEAKEYIFDALNMARLIHKEMKIAVHLINHRNPDTEVHRNAKPQRDRVLSQAEHVAAHYRKEKDSLHEVANLRVALELQARDAHAGNLDSLKNTLRLEHALRAEHAHERAFEQVHENLRQNSNESTARNIASNLNDRKERIAAELAIRIEDLLYEAIRNKENGSAQGFKENIHRALSLGVVVSKAAKPVKDLVDEL